LVVGAQGIRSAQDYRRTENAHAYEVVAILKSQPPVDRTRRRPPQTSALETRASLLTNC